MISQKEPQNSLCFKPVKIKNISNYDFLVKLIDYSWFNIFKGDLDPFYT